MDGPIPNPALPPPIPSAPPTQRGSATPPPKPSAWPNVLGIIAIVLGSLGALGGILSFAFFVLYIVDTVTPEPAEEASKVLFAAMQPVEGWMVALSAAGTLLALALIIGGVGLVLRRSWCRPVLLWWAAGKCVYVLAYSVVSYLSQRAQFEAMRQQMGGPGPGPPNWAMDSFALVGTLIYGVIGLFFPIFAMFWLARPIIRAEIESWRDPGAPPTGRA